jgi:hypothetical protein
MIAYSPHVLANIDAAGDVKVQIGPHVFHAQLIPRGRVERSTGHIQLPELVVQLQPDVVDALARCYDAISPYPVVAVFAHSISARAAVIGTWATSGEARGWWRWSGNRLARDAVFVIAHTTQVPVKDGPEPGDRPADSADT